MAKPAKVLRNEWQVIDGVLSIVLYGKDSIGREIAVALPAAALQVIAPDAKRRLVTHEAQGGSNRKIGPWESARFLPVQTMNVGITDANAVALVLDPDLDTELSLAIVPADARQLGHRLVETAERASGASPTKN